MARMERLVARMERLVPREQRELLRNGEGRARLPLMITPMIDVVFLLLIYFFLTVQFGAEEVNLRTESPVSEKATASADPYALEIEPLVIRITRAGDGASITLSSGLRAPNNTVDLEQILRDSMLDASHPQGLFAADHPIRLAPARDAPWNEVVAVFNAVMSAGYRSVAFGGLE